MLGQVWAQRVPTLGLPGLLSTSQASLLRDAINITGLLPRATFSSWGLLQPCVHLVAKQVPPHLMH